MYLKSIKVKNYKCFKDTKRIEFRPGFNIVTGKNNSGKSTLFECITHQSLNFPHKILCEHPQISTVIEEKYEVEYEIFATRNELNFIRSSEVICFHLPSAMTSNSTRMSELVLYINNLDSFVVRSKYSMGIYNAVFTPVDQYFSGSDMSYSDIDKDNFTQFRMVNGLLDGHWNGTANNYDMWNCVVSEARGNVFCFRSERMNIQSATIGQSLVLNPNASNLPEVLHNLQANHALFKRYSDAVSSVLPQVRGISVVNEGNGFCGIRIWTHDPDSERDDLCRKLSECGTGISQVLAILYVVICSKNSHILLIDEPNSFLHPGAVRKLLSVMSRNTQHQYIISTHSPGVISAVDPATITLVLQEDEISDFEQIDPKNHTDLRRFMAELGVSLSEVFGADNILWVEGPTEEVCFPKILERLANRQLMGTAIVSVVHTGDFEAKAKDLRKTILEIYTRLSSGNSIIPPAISFIFDRESKKDSEIADMEKMGSGKIKFLPRMLYENYLIDFDVIANILNQYDLEKQNYSGDQVREVCDSLLNENPGKYSHKPGDETYVFIRDVHAAKLLSDIFLKITESRVEYRKTTHSVALTEYLIEHKPELIKEIADFLLECLDGGAKTRPAGLAAGQFSVPPDFDDSLPKEILDAFEGN